MRKIRNPELYELARSRGVPEHVARRVTSYRPSQHRRAEAFVTDADRAREREGELTLLLGWLVDFVQDGYEAAVARHGLDMRVFLFGYVTQRPDDPNLPAAPALSGIQQLRDEIREGLIGFLRDRHAWRTQLKHRGEIEVHFNWYSQTPSARFTFDWRAAFITHAANIINSHGRRVKRCSRPECQRLYVPNKRQAFCSRSCSLKERQRRFRQRFSEEEWKRRRHKSYVKRVSQLSGPATANHVKRRQGSQL
jgi:hypothetical protein